MCVNNVYVSSTSKDLAEYRRAVIEALNWANYHPVCMEYHTAVDAAPREESLRGVRGCQFYVGIFAWRYGFIPPGHDEAMTHSEFIQAKECGIPTLIFLLDEDTDWPLEHRDTGVNAQRIRELRESLKKEKWVGFFTTPDNLATQVLASINRAQIKKDFINATNPTEADTRKLKEVWERFVEEYFAQRPAKGSRKRTRIPIPVPDKPIRHFQDREDELAEMHRCLADGKAKLIFISGRGGAGKTSLAVKLIQQLMGESIVYLSMIELENRSPDRIVEIVARTFDDDQAEELRGIWNQEGAPLSERLARLLKGPLARHRVLVVLDNLDSVMDENNRIAEEFASLRDFVDAFLEYDHASMLIATSRRTLLLSPDTEIGITGRKIEIRLDEGLPEEDAVELLRQFDCEDRELGIRKADDQTLRDLVRRCHCVPRTLETVVIKLRQHPAWVLDTLLSQTSLLADLVEDPAREVYRSLTSGQERLVMQVLAVYNKPVPSAAVRSVLPALPVDEILDKLVLDLVAVHDRGRFWLHPLDREYAYDQIPAEEGDYSKPALHESVARFYLNFPCPAVGNRESFDDITPLLDAVENLLAAGQAETAAAVFLDNSLHDDLDCWGHYIILEDICSRLLSQRISVRQKIVLSIRKGKTARNRGDLEKAKDLYQGVLPLIGDGTDGATEAALFNAMGDIHYYQEDLVLALEYLRRAETLLTAVPVPLLRSENAGVLGNVMYSKGDFDEAERYYELAIEHCREVHNTLYEGIWNGGLGNVHIALFRESGKSIHREKASAFLTRAISLAEETNDRRHECHWGAVLGSFYRRTGETALAEEHLQRAFRISEIILYGRLMDFVAANLIKLYLDMPSYERACEAAGSFWGAARKIAGSELQAKADLLCIGLIDTLIQRGQIECGMALGRQFLSEAEDCMQAAAISSKFLAWGKKSGHREFFELSVEAITTASAPCREPPFRGFFSQRATAYALLGEVEAALADYKEALREDSEDLGIALSRAEVLIWAGRYNEARYSLENLSSRLQDDSHLMVHSWLMCHALNLLDEDYSYYQRQLEGHFTQRVVSGYGFGDMEIHLRGLDPAVVSERQISNAWRIQNLITRSSSD